MDELFSVFYRRPLLKAALGAWCGMAVYTLAEEAMGVTVLFVALFLLLLSILLCRRATLILALATLVIGSALLQAPHAPDVKSGVLTGIVENVSSEDDSKAVLTVGHAAIDGTKVRGKVELTVYDHAEAVVGQELAVAARFRFADAEWVRYDQSRGVAIRATGSAETLALGKIHRTVSGMLTHLREVIGNRIDQLFLRHADVAHGLLLGGAVSRIDEQTLRDFRETGTAHLLAVSGLHVGILTTMMLFAVQFVRRLPLRMLLLSLMLLFYAALTGFSPSVLRASIMALIAAPAMPLGRRIDLASSLAFAFASVLILQPFSLFSASFQLSFLAVAGLVLVMPLLQKAFSALDRRVGTALAAGLSVIVSTAPSMARFFGEVGFSSLAANLLMLPLVPFFIIPAVIALIASAVWLPLGIGIAKLPQLVLTVMTRIAAAGGAIALPVPPPSGMAFFLYFAVLCIVSPLCRWSAKRKIPCAAIGAVLCIFIW